MTREVVLVYSMSELARDERVQKQIRLCAADYDVISVGLGPYDGPVVRHIDLREISRPPPPTAALPSHNSTGLSRPLQGDVADSGPITPAGSPVRAPSPLSMLFQVIRREGLLVAALRVLRKLVPGLIFTTTAIKLITADRRRKKIASNELKRATVAAERKLRAERLAAHRKLQIEQLATARHAGETRSASAKSLRQNQVRKSNGSVIAELGPTDTAPVQPPFPSILWCPDFEAASESVPRSDRAFFAELREELGKSEQLELERRSAPIVRLLTKIDFCLAIANDLSSINVVVPLAKEKQAKVIYDAHEFSPGQRVLTETTAWSLYLAAYKLGKYLPLCDEVLTACDASSDEHVRWFNVRRPITITNAPNYVALAPTPLDADRVRLIHHGVATRPRELENMIDTVQLLDERFSLDFFVLTPDSSYFEELKNRCRGSGRIRFLPTVPSSKIAESINCYDMGFYILPPANFNQKYALPNKFFEFIQARLAVAIAPSPEMMSYVKKYDLGVVAKAFTPTAMAEALDSLTPEALWRYKINSHRHASELSAVPQMRQLKEVIEGVMRTKDVLA